MNNTQGNVMQNENELEYYTTYPPLSQTRGPNSIVIPIKPVTITHSYTIDRIDVVDIKIVPFKNAVIILSCYQNLRDIVLKEVEYTMTDEEYAQWGNDDSYLYEWVCNKFNAEQDKSIDVNKPISIKIKKT